MRVDKTYLGKNQKFITVVSNLGSGEPLWFGREGKKAGTGLQKPALLALEGSADGGTRDRIRAFQESGIK
jgi:hypothetical protein